MIITSPAIFSMGAMAFTVITPFVALWFEFFKRKPYVEVKKDVPY